MDDDALQRKKNELAAWISNGTITSATLSQWFPALVDINAPLSTCLNWVYFRSTSLLSMTNRIASAY